MTILHSGEKYDVWLEDNGTLDTVVTVRRVLNNKSATGVFSNEMSSQYHKVTGQITSHGLRALAISVIEGQWDELEENVGGK